MTERLQDFGFQDSPYERVERPWTCGRPGAEACHLGPDRRGLCRGRSACRPVRDESGNGWRCARFHEDGGPCAQGPGADGSCAIQRPPCQPVRSVRSRRGVVVRSVFTLTLGALLLLLFGPARDGFVSPGPLSDPHHRLGLACSACHGAGASGPASWVHWATDGDTRADMTQRCGVCHRFSGQRVARDPHGLPTAELRRLRAAQLGDGHAADGWTPQALACGRCHGEHHGRERRLVPTGDGLCADCHARPFAAFTQGHPEFPARWPYERRDPVAFDHKAHYGTLFGQKAKEAPGWTSPRCTLCHRPGGNGGDMRTRFEEHCQACHGGRMSYAGGSPDLVALRFVQVPWFDEGARPKGWPEDVGVMDPSNLSISPEMQILLGKDRATWKRVRARVDTLDDLLGLGEDARADVGAFLHAVRHMLEELGGTDRDQALAAVARRLHESLGARPSMAECARLWPQTLQRRASEALAAWFGGKPAPSQEGNRFRIDGDEFSLDLVPTYDPQDVAREHGDPTLAAWVPWVLRLLDTDKPLAGAQGTKRIALGVQRCLQCHNVDRDVDGSLTVRWSGRPTDAAPLDRFVHAPHLGQDMRAMRPRTPAAAGWAKLPVLTGDPLMLNCLTCHEPTGDDAHDDFFLHTFTPPKKDGPPAGRTDPAGARSNFAPIARALCARCHRPGDVRSDCLTCHSYHPGRHETRTAPTKAIRR
jgi:hypothetical protein